MAAIFRKGDSNTGGGILVGSSGNVFANGLNVGRVADAFGPPGASCPGEVVVAGSGTVFINGISCARLGDLCSCYVCASGSANVFVGG